MQLDLISGNFSDLPGDYGPQVFRTNAPRTWSDDFSSGVLSPRYVTGGATWSIVDVGGGVLGLVNTPGFTGGEIITDPGFDDAGSWDVSGGWSVAGGFATFTAGTAGNLNDLAAVAVANKWYRKVVDVITLSNSYIRLYTGGAYLNLLYSTSPFVEISRSVSTQYPYIYGAATVNAVLTGYSVKRLTTNNLFLSVLMATPKVLASVGITRASIGSEQGLAICVDNPVNPLNYILCRTDGKTNLIVEKILNGAPTPVLTHAYTYGAGKVAYVDFSALPTVKYGYDGVEFGSDTISDAAIINNRYHGTFGTASGYAEGYFSDLSLVCS